MFLISEGGVHSSGYDGQTAEPGSSLDSSYLLGGFMHQWALSPSSRTASLKGPVDPATAFLRRGAYLRVYVWTCVPLLMHGACTVGSGFSVRLAWCAWSLM